MVLLLLAGAVVGPAAWEAQRALGGTAATGKPPGLLIVYGADQHAKVAAFTFTGTRLQVPAPARTSPFGLSPDSSYLADIPGSKPGVTDYGLESRVEVRRLKGGRARVVITGTGPAFAWSPAGERLAASANGRSGATRLRIYDRDTGRIRSLRLPVSHVGAERASFRLLSWSPDGSRLLLEESNPYDQVAIVTLDLRSERLRTVATFGHKDEPAVVWSPNGRYVALASGEGFSSRDYLFAVIDVGTGKALMQCTGVHHCDWVPAWPLAWASDSRSLFARSPDGIERLDLAWRHSRTVAVSARDVVVYLLATNGRLVFNVVVSKPEPSGDWTTVSNTLYLHDLATHENTQLLQVRGAGESIQLRALRHLP